MTDFSVFSLGADFMKILFASDSFKGSLSSEKICMLLDRAAKRVFPQAETQGLLVADGGEGTVDAVVKELKGSYCFMDVKDPLFRNIRAAYGLLPNGEAVIEMAAASGLTLVPAEKRNPLFTTSYGTGMMIKDAAEKGCKKITVAIGGSATNDGGMGAMSALGVRFYDKYGNILLGKGGELEKVAKIDTEHMVPALRNIEFTVMCDVNNPLLGEQGATFTFGAQKGGSREILCTLEEGMKKYASVAEAATNKSVSGFSGAGAAGGLGFALMAFLNARLKPGIETVLDLIDFDNKLQSASLVITGEGRMDWQSSFGKVPSGVGKRCQKAGVPAVAVVGGLLPGYESIYNTGIMTVVTTVNGVMSMDEAIERCEELYEDAAYRLLKAVKCGMEMASVF